MLSKKERLSREAFNRFFSVGKRSQSSSFQLVYAPHTELHASVVVSKKIAKSAVVRNKIRRRIYDIVRNYRSENKVTGVFIFFTKNDVKNKTYRALKDEVQNHIETTLKKLR